MKIRKCTSGYLYSIRITYIVQVFPFERINCSSQQICSHNQNFIKLGWHAGKSEKTASSPGVTSIITFMSYMVTMSIHIAMLYKQYS